MVPKQALEIATMRFLSIARAISVIAFTLLLANCGAMTNQIRTATGLAPVTHGEAWDDATFYDICGTEAEKAKYQAEIAKQDESDKKTVGAGAGIATAGMVLGAAAAAPAAILAAPFAGLIAMDIAQQKGPQNAYLCQQERNRREGKPSGTFQNAGAMSTAGPSAGQIATACREGMMSTQWMAANCLTQ